MHFLIKTCIYIHIKCGHRQIKSILVWNREFRKNLKYDFAVLHCLRGDKN
jgi:hypothetical protein